MLVLLSFLFSWKRPERQSCNAASQSRCVPVYILFWRRCYSHVRAFISVACETLYAAVLKYVSVTCQRETNMYGGGYYALSKLRQRHVKVLRNAIGWLADCRCRATLRSDDDRDKPRGEI